jgi:hypothetical protein
MKIDYANENACIYVISIYTYKLSKYNQRVLEMRLDIYFSKNQIHLLS